MGSKTPHPLYLNDLGILRHVMVYCRLERVFIIINSCCLKAFFFFYLRRKVELLRIAAIFDVPAVVGL
jgi:hypothetical protein